MTAGDGVPLAVIVSEANRHDVNFPLPLVFACSPRLGGLPGRPRDLPSVVRADIGYASGSLLALLHACGSETEIPQRGQDVQPRLGKRRWPVDRTLACGMIVFKEFARH